MPIGLSDVFGQDLALDRIRRTWAADRLPHGLIFAGPPGVGKATVATALATLFLCPKAKGVNPCGRCPSCVAMSANAHPDFHIITKELARIHDRTGVSKATQLSITVIRQEVIFPAGKKSTLGNGKMFLIEEADLMTTAAQNALLKTLEEPPGRTLIILLARHVSDLLATVRSRCQSIAFAPLGSDVIQRELIKRGIEPAVAAEAADLADGSLGDALRWIADGVLASAQNIVTELDARTPDATILSDLLRQSADALAEKTLERDELASKDAATRDALNIYLSIAAAHLRRRLRSPDPDLVDRACDAIEAIARAAQYLDANVNVALVLTQLGLALTP